MKVYVVEYREVKKNVETFGLKKWFEGICLVVEISDNSEISPQILESAKVHSNLGKIQSRKNNVQVPNRKGIIETRPQNMFENLDDLIVSGSKCFKNYHYSNKINIQVPFVVYNKLKGIYPVEHVEI